MVTLDRVQRALVGMRYPADRTQLIRHAAAQGADDDVLGHLCLLPERDYEHERAVLTMLTDLV